MRLFRARPTYAGVRLYTAVLLTLGAAAIHLVVAPPHFREYAPFGVCFFVVGCAQMVYAIELLLRPTRRLALALGAGSAALVGLWYVSRTTGLPVGPTPGVPEEVGLTDIVCVIMETLSTLLFAVLAIRPPRRQLRRPWLRVLASAPSALITLALTAAAVASTLTAMPESVSAAPLVAGQSAASVAQLTEPPGEQPVDRYTLVAQVSQIDGQTLWTYNGVLPGPELRVRQGDRVQVTLINQLPEATTVHWHGLRVPNAEDGVAGITQDAVAPGDAYTYEFVANEPGTFWYHSHQQTEEQLPRGLFGALVVEPPRPTEERDYAVVLYGAPGHVRLSATQLEARPGERVRLRLINAVAPGMDGGPETPVLLGTPFTVAALDGRELSVPAVLGPTRVPLGMGQRADLVFTMPASSRVELRLAELQGQTSPVQNAISALFPEPSNPSDTLAIGDGPAPQQVDVLSAPLFDLLHYGAPSVAPVAAYDQESSLVLEKHPAFRNGRPELVHTMNGQASPDVAPLHVSLGQRVLLHIVNNTDEYHPMHIHGHVFSVLSRDGSTLSGSPVVLDTLLVGPSERWDVAFVADNPGVWMLHCHVLLHAGMGMSMSLTYAGYYSPFEMGSRSGNMPE